MFVKKYTLLHDNTIKTNNESIYINEVKKTSDNIFDLVDVGDLVEKDNDWEILKVMRFNMDKNMVCLIHTSSNIEEYEINEYRKKFITAIYKRQTNGDYKRYEIGGKE